MSANSRMLVECEAHSNAVAVVIVRTLLPRSHVQSTTDHGKPNWLKSTKVIGLNT